VLCDLEHAKLTHHPYNQRYERTRQEETRKSSKGTLAHRSKGILRATGAALADRLQGAHIPGDHGKDRHADAALCKEADEGILEEARGLARLSGRQEEVPIESAGEMGEDDGEGGKTTESLVRMESQFQGL